MSLNHDIADLFHSLGALMELKGESVFKVIAFQKVGRILRDSNIDLKRAMEEGTLGEIEGIGKSSQQIIEEFIKSGKSTVFNEIAESVPAGLVELMQIGGLGPKTINALWQQCGVTSLDQLVRAIEEGKVACIKGMGEKKIAAMKKGIEDFKNKVAPGESVARRTGLPSAKGMAELLLENLMKIPGVIRAEIAGSLRRWKETIGDVDLVASVKDMSVGQSIAEGFCKLPGVVQTLVCGPSKSSVKVANGMQVDLRLVPQENFGAACMYFTGSKDHNVKVRGLALKQKMTLNEWGLYKLDEYDKAKKEIAKPPPIKAVASETEEGIYKKLGMQYVEPELREDRGEVDAARENRLPKLVARADIRGDLHCHTTASDGTASIEDMVRGARDRGYVMIAITDHSKALAMANGLSVERLIQHVENIHKINGKLKGFTILAGSEVDILADGRLDYDDDVLKLLDIVVASPHVSLKQDASKATDRLLRAIDNKYVNIIGHPTGRLIDGREGLPLEMAKVIERAAGSGTALEINAGWPRLDIHDVNALHAIRAGAMLSINTDAHSVEEYDQMELGVSVARRAWATKANVINCMTVDELKTFIARKRDRN
jgi:DNA polymerase (family 10)